jgi:hypothetical protein
MRVLPTMVFFEMAGVSWRQAWGVGDTWPFLLLAAGTACDGAAIEGGRTLQGLWNAENKTGEGWPSGSCAAQSCSLGSDLAAFDDFAGASLALVGRFRACSGPASPVPDYAGDEYDADGTHYYLLGSDLHRDPDPSHQNEWSIVQLSKKEGFVGNVQFKIALDNSVSVDWVVLSNCPRVLSNNGTIFVGVPEAR